MKTPAIVRSSYVAILTPLVLLLAVPTAQAGTIEVRQDGMGDSTTIQGGISVAQPGDLVLVHAGIYLEAVLVNKELVVSSVDGPYETIIDATGHFSSAVTLSGPLTSASSFEGFGVRRGTGSGIDAGGIMIEFCSPVVRQNVVYLNAGGGLSARGAGTPRFEANLVYRNTGTALLTWASRPALLRNSLVSNGGYGIQMFNDRPSEITSNLIARNLLGGIDGILPGSLSTLEITNNTIVRNGWGIRLDYFPAQITLRRNIVASNRGAGIHCANTSDPCPTLVENDAWHNAGGDYQDVDPGPNDFSLDPQFCDPGVLDYELRSLSPCSLGPNEHIGAYDIGC
jgi:hypothetical protein